MSNQIEIEFKNLVTEKEFMTLLDTFNVTNDDFFEQTNHYFDTAAFSLKQQHAALRIRELPERHELTLKIPQEIGLLEINQMINEEAANQLLNANKFPFGEVHERLQEMGIQVIELRKFGSLTTKRAEKSYKDGLLVFDHSFYGDVEDYELEYECDQYEVGKEVFFHLLHQLNIPVRATDNKIKRLYQSVMGEEDSP